MPVPSGKYFPQTYKHHSYKEDVGVSDCCLMPTQQFSAISWRKQQVNFQWR